MTFDDLVVLVPGFLGFSRTGGYYYFADRLSAALRGGLETALRRPVPVVPACTLPLDHLAARQQYLMSEVRGIIDRAGGVKRVHLVGHSAGGVDAQLATCDQPLASDRWGADDERLRDKIASVVGIAAPHHGTCLADAPVADLLADPLRHMHHLPELVPLLLQLSQAVVRWDSAPVIGTNALMDLPDSARFLWEVLASRGLIYDLSPRAMAAVRNRSRSSRNIPLRSFVTTTAVHVEAEAFFRELRAMTADTSRSPAQPTQHRAAEVLREAASGAIQSGGDAPTFNDSDNDGVVNSVRQLLRPDDPKELAGIVVCDHADVLGHYNRTDALIDDEPLNRGLFRSGSAFGDDQFFELCREVTRVLVEVVRTHE
ncbi:MAG: hypothetical protein OXU20_06095 [Myxococcales bacterium]|nr:hypothetical protein [Myxococcales bacterium]MDD9970355.1 hypothetical protein [Myxococcales bacterium]